jgi:hypothetical protein
MIFNNYKHAGPSPERSVLLVVVAGERTLTASVRTPPCHRKQRRRRPATTQSTFVCTISVARRHPSLFRLTLKGHKQTFAFGALPPLLLQAAGRLRACQGAPPIAARLSETETAVSVPRTRGRTAKPARCLHLPLRARVPTIIRPCHRDSACAHHSRTSSAALEHAACSFRASLMVNPAHFYPKVTSTYPASRGVGRFGRQPAQRLPCPVKPPWPP